MKLEMRVMRHLGSHLMKFVCRKYVYDVLGSHLGAVSKVETFSYVKFAKWKGSNKAFEKHV